MNIPDSRLCLVTRPWCGTVQCSPRWVQFTGHWGLQLPNLCVIIRFWSSIFFVGFSPEHVQLGVVCVRLSGVLGSVYTGCERQCSVNAAMTLAILLWLKTKSRSKMGCNPIWGNLSGVLKISSSVITALTLHWRWRSYKRAFNLRTDIQLHQEARISDFLLFSTGGGQRLRSWVNPWIVPF